MTEQEQSATHRFLQSFGLAFAGLVVGLGMMLYAAPYETSLATAAALIGAVVVAVSTTQLLMTHGEKYE